ncbi:MAG: hypothetical protein Q8R11_01700, partial [bacterium]|nr:hypothetical protein [bacterium]
MTNVLRFPYTGELYLDPQTMVLERFFRPYIPVQLMSAGRRSDPFDCLLDSGSDSNLFPAAWAEWMDI